MAKKFNLAVLGVGSVLGQATLDILAQRKFPVENIYALDSKQLTNDTVSFGNREITLADIDTFDFSKVHIAFFIGKPELATYVPKATDRGCIVIDSTSAFRDDIDVPLIVPEVNPDKISAYSKKNIIANPNCSTIQMMVALKPIYDEVGINRITLSTYHSVSDHGKEGISELIEQSTSFLEGKEIQPKVFPRQIAYNILPQVDHFEDTGYTLEEYKIIVEARKILEDQEIIINPTAVRVPIVYGLAESVTIETKQPITAEAARQLLEGKPGLKVVDKPSSLEYPTPIENVIGRDDVFVGRIRNGLHDEFTLTLWIVCDNVRKGSSLNSVQIAELLVKIL